MTACLTGGSAADHLRRPMSWFVRAAFICRSEAQERQAQRRIDAVFAERRAYLMSDAKWRKLLGGQLSDLRVGMLCWKFLRDERIFVCRPPPRSSVLERGLGDVLPLSQERCQCLSIFSACPIFLRFAYIRIMGRLPRPIEDNLVYHALNRGNNRADIFGDPEDRVAFLAPWPAPRSATRSDSSAIA